MDKKKEIALSSNGDEPIKPLKLRHPFVYNGATISELKLDFESLTADQQLEAERLYKVIYRDASPEAYAPADARFHLILAGMASGISHEELRLNLLGKDHRNVVNRSAIFCGPEAEG